MTTITENLKAYSFEQGIDLVGVAPVDRFVGAPQEHHPDDILPGAKTVISLALHIPSGPFDGPATAYHRAMEVIHAQLDVVAYRIVRYLEREGGRAIAVPSDEPYRHWEAERMYGRGDLSHRHAAQAAGLGRLGKGSLLITQEFGNRVHLVSIVTDMDLSPDDVLDWEPCPPGCASCLRACPAGALNGEQVVDQALCRPVLLEQLPKGTSIESCWACRKACPIGMKHRITSSS